MATKSVRLPVSELRPPAPSVPPDIIVPSSTTVTAEKVGNYWKKAYQFKWEPLGTAASTLYVKYRIVENQGSGVSMWSVPTSFNQPFFDIYHRQTATVIDQASSPRSWEKILTVADNVTPLLAAPWQGAVQYCIALAHPENRPAADEGFSVSDAIYADLSTIRNKFVLYISHPLDTVSLTAP